MSTVESLVFAGLKKGVPASKLTITFLPLNSRERQGVIWQTLRLSGSAVKLYRTPCTV